MHVITFVQSHRMRTIRKSTVMGTMAFGVTNNVTAASHMNNVLSGRDVDHSGGCACRDQQRGLGVRGKIPVPFDSTLL